MNLGLIFHFCISLDTNTGDCNAADSPDNTNMCYYISEDYSTQAQAQTICQLEVVTAVPVEITNAQIQTCVLAGFRDQLVQGQYAYFWTGGVYTHADETVQWNGDAPSSTSHLIWRSDMANAKADGPLRMRIKKSSTDSDNGLYRYSGSSMYYHMCQYPYH